MIKNATTFSSYALLFVAILVVADRATHLAPVLWLLRCLYVTVCVLTLYGDWRAGHLVRSLGELRRLGVQGGVQSLALLVGTWAMFITT